MTKLKLSTTVLSGENCFLPLWPSQQTMRIIDHIASFVLTIIIAVLERIKH